MGLLSTKPFTAECTNRTTGTTVTLWNAPAAAPALNSAIGFDAARWTPFGTYLTAEESWGAQPQPYGRLFELTNPTTAAPGAGTLIHRNAIARVSHEGLAFDKNNNLYYIDELNGGSIYRFASATPSTGATFLHAGTNAVLRVGTGTTPNATGPATWVPFTTAAGIGLPGAITITDPNGITAVDGRATTDVAAYKAPTTNGPRTSKTKPWQTATRCFTSPPPPPTKSTRSTSPPTRSSASSTAPPSTKPPACRSAPP